MSDSLQQQMWEIIATQKTLSAELERTNRSIETLSRQRSANDAARRNADNAMTARIVALEKLGTMQHESNGQWQERMTATVAALKEPVYQFVNMKRNTWKVVTFCLAAIGVLWALVEPLYQSFVLHLFGGGKG